MRIGSTGVIVFDDPAVIADASNIKNGGNPPFVAQDFYDIYPNFESVVIHETAVGTEGTLPSAVLDMYIQFANDCVQYKRWKNQWKMAMSLFIAHFCTIYIQSLFPENATAQQVLAYGQAKGLISSKGVGDVSVSYDFSAAVTGVESWGQFNMTQYGIQFANMAKLVAKGGMMVW